MESSHNPPPALILLSGLPGTGKTSLARALARELRFPVFARDRIQSALRRLGLAERADPSGYPLLLDLADEQLSLGVGVILDAVFPMQGYRETAREIARRSQAAFCPIYCCCSDEETWKNRMRGRPAFVPHWTPVGWNEVERLRVTFQAWDPGTALFVDSMRGPRENLNTALAFILAARPEDHPA